MTPFGEDLARASAWVEDYLRSKRDYQSLRDVLLASVRAVAGSKESLETRKERLREVAGICEGNLRDIDGAVSALKQLLALDRSDDTARQALSRILESSGFEARCYLAPEEALSHLDADAPVVIISDYMMPSMDGITFLKHARARFPQAVRILCTAAEDFRVALQAVNSGWPKMVLLISATATRSWL